MDKDKGLKIPVQLRVNMWLGLSAHEKKFNTFSNGNFSVYAEMVRTSAPKYYWKVYIYDLWFYTVMAKMLLLFLRSMRTRLRCLGSGEPPAWSVATSSQTWRERWSSNRSAFCHHADGTGTETGLWTQNDGRCKKLSLSHRSTGVLTANVLLLLWWRTCFGVGG